MRHLLFPLLALAAPLAAQPAEPPPSADADDSPLDDGEIVVTGQRPRGSVQGDIQPEVTLSPADVRSYGVNNISDLLDELAPQTGSTRGQGGAPVVLLNGRRIGSFAEIRDLPTEAIQRVEILPEEVSLKYGYPADQRVVNIVLRRRFRAAIGQAGGGTTTDGGGASINPEANLVRIRNEQRLSINLRYQSQAQLLESQRNLTSIASGRPFDLVGNIAAARGTPEIDANLSALAGRPVTVAGVPAAAAAGPLPLDAFVNDANVTDVAPFRTLRASSHTASSNIVYARPAFGRSTATLNGSLSYATGEGLQGLPGIALTVPPGDPFSPFAGPVALYRYVDGDPLNRRTEMLTAHLGLGLNGDRGQWRWQVQGNYDRTDARTRTETGLDTTDVQARLDARDPALNPFAAGLPLGGLLVNRATAVTNSGELVATAGGPLFRLPAGPVGSNLRVQLADSRFEGTTLRPGLEQRAGLGRRLADGQVNLDLPIASRRAGVLPVLGQLSANANLAVRTLSDFGTLRTVGYGLHWVPRPPIDLVASVTDDQVAPTVQQLGNPQILTPQLRVFDYRTGTTADVVQLSGGNPDLRRNARRTAKLGLTLRPSSKRDFSFIANYVSVRDDGQVANLPEPTADIERAFPERFVRDATGTLVRVDASPVNFARERREQLRFGFNLSVPLRSAAQRRFEAWRAARAAGQDVPPPFPLSARQRERFAAARGGAAGQAPPTGDGARAPAGDGPGQAGGGGGRGFGGGRGGFGRGGGQGGGRLQLALYDTWTLKDTLLIRPGVPVIDLLGGGSVTSGGGVPEHRVELQLGYSNNGVGVRLSGNYQAPTRVAAGGGTGALRFSDLATANLRAFVDFGQLPALAGRDWARGLRATLEVNNITNRRLRVRDDMGTTPLRYQPAYLDPLGRVIRVTVRAVRF